MRSVLCSPVTCLRRGNLGGTRTLSYPMVATRPEPRCQPKTDVMIARADIANGVITPVIAPVITPESQANVVTMPRPKGVFVASTIQVVFEVLNLARALITTVAHFAWVDTSYRRALTSVD